jgi:hypothetical protein
MPLVASTTQGGPSMTSVLFLEFSTWTKHSARNGLMPRWKMSSLRSLFRYSGYVVYGRGLVDHAVKVDGHFIYGLPAYGLLRTIITSGFSLQRMPG